MHRARKALLIGVAAMSVAGSPSAQVGDKPTILPASGTPEWAQWPSQRAFGLYAPGQTWGDFVEGHATLTCTAASTGALEACAVISEQPVGQDFGAAALRISQLYKAGQQYADGRRIQFPVDFIRLPHALRVNDDGSEPLLGRYLTWEKRPTGPDFARVYPVPAQKQNIEGGAIIKCRIGTSGLLETCTALSEEPAEFGFGEAAVSIARNFKVKFTPADGKAVPGATVLLSLAFRLPRG